MFILFDRAGCLFYNHHMQARIIFHVDLDAFFASVEQRDHPEFRGRPLIVGADPKDGKGRGVVSTCSYEARAFGVHSAMPISEAYRRCPDGIYVPPAMEKYQQASRQVFDVFEEFTPAIEPISIDEAFLDMTGCMHFWSSSNEAAQRLRATIAQRTRGLTASVGIAPNKMVAKIASDDCKPDGLLEIFPERLLEYLHPLPVKKLWGIGPRTEEVLNRMGIFKVGDIAAADPQRLSSRLGIHGLHLYELAQGHDEREVIAQDEVKSVSNEETFDQDVRDRELVCSALLRLSEKVSQRLRESRLKGKTLTLKVRLRGFKTYSHAFGFGVRTNHADTIYKKAKELFLAHYGDEAYIRLVGVRLSNFDDGYLQDDLFQGQEDKKAEQVHQALDLIKQKFGDDAIRRAGG